MKKSRRGRDDGELVYSSGPDGARFHGPGGKVEEACGSEALRDLPPDQQQLRIQTDARLGHGKVVTLVRGLVLTRPSLERLAKELKRRLGAGGRLEGATVVVQGDHRDRVAEILGQMGYGLE
ncbi:MAG: translation initiation factor [Candidatus Riflebacteria bacterium]|nr:translation initiation factor [Candidatus Riflebacteria bacterium]